MENLPIKPKGSIKSGTITLAQLKAKFKEEEKPLVVKQDNKQAAREAFLKRKAQAKELRKLLHVTYPDVFDYENPKPLAIRIDKKIRLGFPQYSHNTVRLFLSKWAKHSKYLKCLITSEQRVDLDNQPSCMITEEHKKIAKDMLDKKKTVKSKTQVESAT